MNTSRIFSGSTVQCWCLSSVPSSDPVLSVILFVSPAPALKCIKTATSVLCNWQELEGFKLSQKRKISILRWGALIWTLPNDPESQPGRAVGQCCFPAQILWGWLCLGWEGAARDWGRCEGILDRGEKAAAIYPLEFCVPALNGLRLLGSLSWNLVESCCQFWNRRH